MKPKTRFPSTETSTNELRRIYIFPVKKYWSIGLVEEELTWIEMSRAPEMVHQACMDISPDNCSKI